jgi:hypothetical protein
MGEEIAYLKDLPIVGRIPFERRIAEAYSQGVIPVGAVPSLRSIFHEMTIALQGLDNRFRCQPSVEVGHA